MSANNDLTASLAQLPLEAWLAEVAQSLKPPDEVTQLGAKHHAILTRRSGTLLVTFETLQSILTLSPLAQPFAWDMARREGWSSLVFLSRRDSWFRDRAVFDHVDHLVDTGFFDQFDQVVFYGAGTGAHAAGAFSVAAPGARVFLIQPQATLDPERAGWDMRFPQMRRSDFSSRYGYAPRLLDAAEAAWVLYDPLEREDAMHASLFDAPHITSLPLRGMGAALQTDLSQMGLLHPLLSAAAAGTLSRQGFAEALRARRDHLPYLHRLLRRLEREERDGLIEQLCRHVSARMDAPRFAQRLEKLAAAR